MSTLAEVESAVLKFTPEEQEQLRDWLENLMEDRLEMTDEFKAEIEAGKADIAAGRVRVRRP
jgi:predicted transcriptional regulator